MLSNFLNRIDLEIEIYLRLSCWELPSSTFDVELPRVIDHVQRLSAANIPCTSFAEKETRQVTNSFMDCAR